MKKKKKKYCINCKENEVRAKNLCNQCYRYERRTGHKRPKRLWSKPEYCKNKNCKVPLDTVSRVRKGYCGACYNYRMKYKKERSKELAMPGDKGLGWCSCGNVATKKIYYISDHFNLCSRCFMEVLPFIK